MAKAKAETVSLVKLSEAVERAAKAAADRNNIRLEPGLHLHPGIILGRVIRDNLTMEQAQTVAADIVKGVAPALQATGTAKLSPVVLIRDKLITCGFIDPRQQTLAVER
jgi:hypothetical protein